MATSRSRRCGWLRRLAAASLVVGGTTANAEQAARFDLPAQPLGRSLQQVAERFDLKVAFYTEFTDGLQAPPLRGDFSASEAFDALLDDTPLEYIYVVQTTVAVRPRAAAPTPTAEPSVPAKNPATDRGRAGAVRSFVATLLGGPGTAGSADGETAMGNEDDEVEVVIVTGTRMKLPPAQQVNNVVTFTADDLELMGVATLEEVFRRLPQNIFGATETGGANSTTDFGGGAGGLETLNGTANVTGASTVNLRGIGERGTLILVDGKRIGESGLLGGFSDVSTIPMAMVERVDILLDGASAIYGPDAVGGVVNVILRKDFEGVHLRFRHDAPVQGGSDRQTASLARISHQPLDAMTKLFAYPMVAEIAHGFERPQTALATPSPVFWSRVRTCDLKRSPRYALACEGQAPRAPRLKAPGREHAHGTKILGDHRGHW